MNDDLQIKTVQAAKWSSITEIVVKLVSPVTNMILARILAPEMFGVVATLTMVVSFAEIFTDAGFQKYLIQKEFESEEELNLSTNVAFWTNLSFSFVLWALISVFARPIAELVGSSGHESAIIVMCAQIPIVAFSSIQIARYRRDFDYKRLFIIRLTTAFVPLLITVPLAVLFENYWALVIGTLCRDVVNAMILTCISRWKPKFRFSFRKLQEMLSFSVWTIVENITIWLANYIGTFLIATTMSQYYLGLYKTTVTTVNGYMNLITAMTTSVLFSALSRSQNDEALFRKIFLRFQRMVAMLVFPLGFGIFVFRKLATSILLGSQWSETADFVGLWALTGAIVIIFNHYNSEVFRSKGQPKISVLVQVLHLAVLIPVLLIVSAQSYQTVTLVRSLLRVEICLASLVVMSCRFGFKFTTILKNVGPSLLASLVMAVCGYGLRRLCSTTIQEIVAVLMCCIIYAGCIFMLPAGRRQLEELPVIGSKIRNLSSH